MQITSLFQKFSLRFIQKYSSKAKLILLEFLSADCHANHDVEDLEDNLQTNVLDYSLHHVVVYIAGIFLFLPNDYIKNSPYG